ncbi:hypothetical protein QYE76_047941 [Lolium multiflorum]|uniref:Uncharacterized protein n=1 Tax=Lolium multiflorum TaxID=4521 RepID=A0AAD8X2E9_LOLMU|nr:hypothetical protein QYE76_047941 [Lolium multiflorum]
MLTAPPRRRRQGGGLAPGEHRATSRHPLRHRRHRGARRAHETYIRNTFLGQHMTAGSDAGERAFTGTGASGWTATTTRWPTWWSSRRARGIMATGGANTISGVHCYNKASGFGVPASTSRCRGSHRRGSPTWHGLHQHRRRDPVLLHVSGSFFLGDANVILKAVNGVARGVQITGNLFNGRGKGVDIVQLDGAFKTVEQAPRAAELRHGDERQVHGREARRTGTERVDGGLRARAAVPDRIGHVVPAGRRRRVPGAHSQNVSGNQVVVATTAPSPPPCTCSSTRTATDEKCCELHAALLPFADLREQSVIHFSS